MDYHGIYTHIQNCLFFGKALRKTQRVSIYHRDLNGSCNESPFGCPPVVSPVPTTLQEMGIDMETMKKKPEFVEAEGFCQRRTGVGNRPLRESIGL